MIMWHRMPLIQGDKKNNKKNITQLLKNKLKNVFKNCTNI